MPKGIPGRSICTAIEDGEHCTRIVAGRGLCAKHRARWKAHGDPLIKSVRKKADGRLSGGYVYVYRPDHPLARKGGWIAEHRMVAFDAGLLTDLSLDVHHRDENKQNNDLSNLQVLTRSEHRKIHEATRNAAKTHCPHGHPYDGTNTYISPRGGRICRQCRTDAQNARYHAKRDRGEALMRFLTGVRCG